MNNSKNDAVIHRNNRIILLKFIGIIALYLISSLELSCQDQDCQTV